MGIGSKPFMDIKPSDAAINDRAIDYIMKGSGELVQSICVSTVLVIFFFRLYPMSNATTFKVTSCFVSVSQTGSRIRASIAVPLFEYSASVKRPHSTISNSSTSSSSSQSSSSLLGSLNLHMYTTPSHPHPYPMSSVPPFSQWPYDCIEEDELEQDSGSQPSMSK